MRKLFVIRYLRVLWKKPLAISGSILRLGMYILMSGMRICKLRMCVPSLRIEPMRAGGAVAAIRCVVPTAPPGHLWYIKRMNRYLCTAARYGQGDSDNGSCVLSVPMYW